MPNQQPNVVQLADRRRSDRVTFARRPRVVVADDDEDVRETLARMLACDGFEVWTAGDGATLARMLDDTWRNGRAPDLLLLDQRMPCFTGLDVLADLRARGFTSPAILITAFSELSPRARALGADLIEKPFEPDALRRLVFDLLGQNTRTLDADTRADREAAVVQCVSCGAYERVIDDDARRNPPTWFCLECRSRARPQPGDDIGEGD